MPTLGAGTRAERPQEKKVAVGSVRFGTYFSRKDYAEAGLCVHSFHPHLSCIDADVFRRNPKRASRSKTARRHIPGKCSPYRISSSDLHPIL